MFRRDPGRCTVYLLDHVSSGTSASQSEARVCCQSTGELRRSGNEMALHLAMYIHLAAYSRDPRVAMILLCFLSYTI